MSTSTAVHRPMTWASGGPRPDLVAILALILRSREDVLLLALGLSLVGGANDLAGYAAVMLAAWRIRARVRHDATEAGPSEHAYGPIRPIAFAVYCVAAIAIPLLCLELVPELEDYPFAEIKDLLLVIGGALCATRYLRLKVELADSNPGPAESWFRARIAKERGAPQMSEHFVLPGGCEGASCSRCGGGLRAPVAICRSCATVVHAACWRNHGGCAGAHPTPPPSPER